MTRTIGYKGRELTERDVHKMIRRQNVARVVNYVKSAAVRIIRQEDGASNMQVWSVAGQRGAHAAEQIGRVGNYAEGLAHRAGVATKTYVVDDTKAYVKQELGTKEGLVKNVKGVAKIGFLTGAFFGALC